MIGSGDIALMGTGESRWPPREDKKGPAEEQTGQKWGDRA